MVVTSPVCEYDAPVLATHSDKPPLLRTLLILGRVSNLPTVWSNCLAGWLLDGGGARLIAAFGQFAIREVTSSAAAGLGHSPLSRAVKCVHEFFCRWRVAKTEPRCSSVFMCF